VPDMPFHRSYHRSWIMAAEHLSDPFLYGCYHWLCMHMYERGGGLPNNPRLLKNLLGLGQLRTAEKMRDSLVSAGLLFVSEDNMLHNRKTDQELAKFAERSAKSREKFAQTSQENGAENPTNSTRAHDRAHSPDPEYRRHIREESSLKSTASARTFQGSLIADLLKHRKETDHEPDPQPDQRQIPPSDRR